MTIGSVERSALTRGQEIRWEQIALELRRATDPRDSVNQIVRRTEVHHARARGLQRTRVRGPHHQRPGLRRQRLC
ncbi:hypothetical protein [Lignipirellula cremea]|uniref:hypothetical protein n=1 Tax=Lignipirellula cremea TaxID=2528010 RepID=UPI0011A2ACE8|nr:hypothetical protein [Lignipirellula cremea]